MNAKQINDLPKNNLSSQMTKKLASAILILMCNLSYGQNNTFPASGKVGIGTISPSSQIEILAPAVTGGEKLLKLNVSDAPNDFLQVINTTNAGNIFMPAIWGSVTSGRTTSLYLIAETNVENDIGTIPLAMFDSRVTGGMANNRPLFGWDSYGSRRMTLLANGNLGINTSNPTEKLAVNGNIRAREIKVEVANWPDFVFLKHYDLPEFKDLENYISEHGYLPGIPSAEEVKSNGIELGAINAKLLQKIEELTLYVIKLARENEKQQQEIDQIKCK